MSSEPGQPQLLMRRPDLADLPAVLLPDGYEVRRASQTDEHALAGLLSAAFGFAWTEEEVARSLTRCEDVEAVFIVMMRDEAAATASAKLGAPAFPGSGYLHWVGAHPDHRGQGLGYAVSAHVLLRFGDLGLRDAVLETDDHRLPAIRTYRKLGFVPEFRHDSHPARWRAVEQALEVAKRE